MKAFISYSHKDDAALGRLHTHLAVLRREGRIETWFDRDILAGGEIDAEVAPQLESCELFLLLVSPDFLASDYCYEKEMARALERHKAGTARVIPIIIEPCDWASSPLRALKALPRDGKPVSEWTNPNTAFLDVVTALRRILDEEAAGVAPTTPADEAEPAPAGGGAPQRRYRVKRDFDEIDRGEFRDAAFAAIGDYFERAVAEIDGVDDLRARFRPLSPTSFGATIVNRARDRGTAHITVHCRSGRFALGDIYYSFTENAPDNTANGSFNIESDEFELFLTSMSFYGGERERLSPEAAAEKLWSEFLRQAGISYD